jgi:hypothetical protein
VIVGMPAFESELRRLADYFERRGGQQQMLS